ncbi:uncharacterized protein LOC123005538 [Tribolium madens]|uniref:uncharacterized protein LOC123005538 n=1 Tax=Tribolium madens TaxID=41895 RepID=UPI001CF74B3C|nr:uncharacterized protein LOC123005538 [Tribolium madens]
MSLKIAVSVCLAIIALDSVLGAPHSSHKEQDLRKSFVEFLQQDKELSSLLEKANLGSYPSLSRAVRQAEEDDVETDQDVDTPKQEGFFDRAAKFVMEVLQRFLKWVNSDN